MTQDKLATRLRPKLGGHVVDVYDHSFGKITAIYPESDEIVIKTNKGSLLTISNTSIYYNDGGEYALTDDIDLNDAVTPTLTGVDALLAEREVRYGAYKGHAKISQGLKYVMGGTDGWETLYPYQKEALEMIAHKIARVLNGDPSYADNWVDIAGYAQLVVNELENN